MDIEIIEDLATFEAIRPNWENIYHQDTQAQFFISWSWISVNIEYYSRHQLPWLILAAKADPDVSDYVGFFPLLIGVATSEGGDCFYNELSLLGVTDGEHPGCLSLPGCEAEVVAAFAIFLQQLDFWSVLSMHNLPQANRRLNLLLTALDSAGFETKESSQKNYQNSLDRVNNQIVPYLTLPDSWEQYLKNSLSSNTRQKVRRFLRKVENSFEYKIVDVNVENIERHIEAITELWRASWESRKGIGKCRKILRRMSFELRRCFERGCLHLPILWQGNRPLAAIANLVDFDKKTILFFVGGRDETFRKFPSGFVLHARAIRDAIEHGFKTYDFLSGNEAYKYSFGAKDRQIHTVNIERQNCQAQAKRLDRRTLPALLEVSQRSHQANNLALAETGYRQILAVQPEHTAALYGLSAIAQRQGRERDARDCLNLLLQIEPSNTRAWFGLGTLHQSHERLSAAEAAYQQALSHCLDQNIAMAIYHNLGYALQQQEKLDEAIICYQKARELQPNSIEAEVVWANALHLKGQLSDKQQLHYAAVNLDLGHKRRQANDYRVAIEYYQQAIALNPNLAEAHYHLGKLHQVETKNWEQAIVHYQTALELQPDSILTDVAMANLRQVRGELSAEQRLKYALLNQEVGDRYLQLGDLKAAAEHYHQAIALNPDLAEAYYGLASSLHGQSTNNLPDSIAYYQKALQLKPNFKLANVGLAAALHTQGNLSSAQRLSSAMASYELGNKYMETKDFQFAVKYYELAVRLNPELSEARHNLRLALEQKEQRTIKVSTAKQ